MTFSQSIETCIQKKSCCFTGRATRSEFWYFELFSFIIGIVTSVLDTIIDPNYMVISALASLALLLPGLGVTWRRLHDTGRSGAWYFIGLVPLVGWIVLLVFLCQDTQQGDNAYGPVPEDYYV